MAEIRKWLPLESNPEVMNKFLRRLGVPRDLNLIDIVDIDSEHLHELPTAKALLLLFPAGEEHEEHCRTEQDIIDSDGQTVSDRVYFVRLEANNASGTVALIHSVTNADDNLQLSEDSCLKEFVERTRDMTPEERGQELEMDEAIGTAHESVAQEGQTEAPEADEETNLHFITFVSVDEQLYELDAHKSFPINHGSTSNDTMLRDAIGVCRQFMERDPENVNFSLMALIESAETAEEAENEEQEEEEEFVEGEEE